jgi:copper(I)-binding protein
MLLHGHSLTTAVRRACAIAAAAAIPLLAGCEAGLNAPVLHWHSPTAGANKSIPAATGRGFIAIRNVFVLGAPLNASLPAGSSASVFLAFVNTGARDRLVSVSAPGTATSVTLPAGGVTLERSRIVLLAGPQPQVVLTGLTHTLPSGGNIRLVLRFQNAGSVVLFVPVIPKASYYATYSPAPSPTPTPTATRKHRHHGQPSATATPSPGTTATATATATP